MDFILQSLKPYESYKNAGVEWIDKIPQEWSVSPLFTVAREKEKRNLGNQVQNVLSLSYGKIIDKDVSDNFGLLPDSFETYQIVGKDDIILRLTDLQNDKRSLRVGLVNHPGIITSAYVCLDFFREIVPSYAYYLLHAYDITKVFYSFGGGVRQTMKFEDLKWLPILIPSLKEQRAITAFLYNQTATIDALIAKKERLIELLQEKRTALITHTVTKGLDPNVPMKDSGIEWLGKIPAHWDVIMLKRLASIRAGVAITSEKIEPEGEYPVFGGNGIRGYTGEFTHSGAFPLIGRQGALCGCINFASGRFWASEHALVAIPIPVVDSYWLTYLLQAMSLNSYSQSAAQPGLAVETLGAIRTPLPETDEQRAIIAFLDRENKGILDLEAKVREAIDHLKEYRTALISAAVTGRIDLRDFFSRQKGLDN